MSKMGRMLGLKPFGNIIAMKPKQEPHNTRSLLWQMEAYWRALPRSGPVPRRSDVDPRGVESLLRNAIILERVAPGVARFRIAGQHLTDLTGMEVRGMPLTALFSAASRAPLGAALSEMFDRPAILHAHLTGAPHRGGEAISGQMMLLPLCLENGEVSRAMGAIVTNAQAETNPCQLHSAAFDLRPLPTEHAEPGQYPMADSHSTDAHNTAFAEEAAPLRGQPPKLRIVHSND